jgi:hypothetical protein
MSVFPPASPQGPSNEANAPIDSGYPVGASPSGNEVKTPVIPHVGGPAPVPTY